MTKYLIINADDFGYSIVFNETILELIESNQLMSTTVMINWVDKKQKTQIERLIDLSHKVNLSIGLHVEFLNREYNFQLKQQFDKFINIFNFKPSHIDIHKTHRDAYLLVSEFCKKVNIPCRNHGLLAPGVKAPKERFFSGTVSDFSLIEKWVKTLKENDFHEILFHPGKYDPNCKSSLNKDRERDVQHIIRLNSILKENNIKLVSYLDLAATI